MPHVRIIFCLLFLLVSTLYSEGAESDSLIFRNYEAGNYQATSINYSGEINEEGIAFFANESGVLEYDGSVWDLTPLKNFSPAISLHITGSRIYVGGRNEFGYLQPDSLGRHQYVSLRHLLNLGETEMLGSIWQIEQLGEDIYFESQEMILRYDGENIHKIALKGAYIFKIGNQLFASAMSKGLAKIEGDSAQFVNTRFSFEKDMAFGFVKGLKGENLVLTPDNGIYEIDTATYKTKEWDVPANDFIRKSSLYYGLVLNDSLYAFSTYLGGLVLVNAEGSIVKIYTKENGLVSKALREMFTDKRGNLWITTDYGLSHAVLASEVVRTEELNTRIRFISLQEKEIFISGNQLQIYTEEDYAGSVVFHFATPGFHKEDLEYSYFLEGFDKDWSFWRNDVKKEYTNLSGGEYTFHVKARYLGEKESEPAAASLLIPTPWYKTTSAYFLGALFLGSLILFVVHYRTKRLRLLNKRLAKIINNRTRELVEQREQLRATNNELRIKNIELDNFVYRSSHDLVAPLKSMKGLIHIARMEKEAANQDTYLSLMLTSVDKLETFIKSIMEYSSNTKKELILQKIDLHEVLDSIIEDLKYYEKAEKIEIIRSFEPGLQFCSDPKRLEIVLSNLITNSIKYHNYYQDYLFIEVKAERVQDQFLRIQIIDNGRGIEPEFIDKIFEMFFRASNSAEGSGLGLYIVKDTVKKLGGEISVTSNYGKGTTFSLLFPLNEPKSSATAE
jgi:signal transduction histidine kinase